MYDAKLDEQVFDDIMNTAAFQRIEGVNQLGPKHYLKPGYNFSRAEHCRGTAALLRQVDAPMHVQLAGLLHDIAHLPFSHAIDYVTGNSYHDLIHERVVRNSAIPTVLRDHGFSLDDVVAAHDHPLLDRAKPGIDADRVDYTLREMALSGVDEAEAQRCAAALTAGSELAVEDARAGRVLAEQYVTLNAETWSNPRMNVADSLVGLAIREGLRDGLSEGDLVRMDDADLHTELEHIPAASKYLDILEPSFELQDEGRIRYGVTPRHVDPPVRVASGTVPTSRVDPETATVLRGRKDGEQWYGIAGAPRREKAVARLLK